MSEEQPIVNRVASSGLITFDLEKYYLPGDRVQLDLAKQLHEGLILREADFRQFIKSTDWSVYAGKVVAVYCSVDAIIPHWAYMLVTIALQPFAKKARVGSLEQLEIQLLVEELERVNWHDFQNKKLVVKGCGHYPIPQAIYALVAEKLRPVAASIMFGEPCSTVPLFKALK
jgi:hypothetical protein